MIIITAHYAHILAHQGWAIVHLGRQLWQCFSPAHGV